MSEQRKRRLVFLVSTHGKTEDEIVSECMREYEKWQATERPGTVSERQQRHKTPDSGTITK